MAGALQCSQFLVETRERAPDFCAGMIDVLEDSGELVELDGFVSDGLRKLPHTRLKYVFKIFMYLFNFAT